MSKSKNIALPALAALSLLAMFVASGEPVPSMLRGGAVETVLLSLGWSNTIVFGLSTGYLVAFIFWVMVVYSPERRRRNMLRTNLSRRYQYFKEEVIQSLLWAAGGTHDSELPRQLSDHKEFKAYFSSDENRQWYAAINGLQSDDLRLHEIILAMDLFTRDVAYFLDHVPIDGDDAHSLLKQLNESVYRLKHSQYDRYDQVKSLGRFLWSVLARWSFIDGQLDADPIQSAIDRL